ncbi:MAG: hypothetical protein ACLTK0_10165 [Anaerovoracaceae bacterium]
MADGFDAAKYKDTEFEFKLDLSELTKNTAKIFDRSGDQQGGEFLIKTEIRSSSRREGIIYISPDGQV